MASLLLLLVLAPIGAAAWSGARHRRSAATPPVTAVGAGGALVVATVLGVLVARGDRPRWGDAETPWLQADPLGVAVALVAAVLGVTILSYAARNLEGDARAWRFSALANGMLAATLLSSVAGRLSVLVGAWLLASAGIIALIAYRGDGPSRAAARRAGLALGLGDAALVGALGVVLATVGDPGLDQLGAVATDLGDRQLSVFGLTEIGAAGAVAVLLVLAAAARASQIPFPLWLPGTLAAPTPVSAFLHAGAVNAGGFLLVRLSPVLSESATASVVLAAIAITTIVVAAGAALIRTDVKGSLATSTSPQMGFMLLAVAVGAPLAAIPHLTGHPLYKASRFLGAGDALTAVRVARRHRPPPPGAARWRLALSVLVPAAVFAAIVVLVEPSVLHDGEGWVIGLALGAVGVRATWAWLGRGPLGPTRVAGAAMGIGFGLVGYLGLVGLLDHLLGTGLAVDAGTFVDARWALGVLLVAMALGAIGVRRPTTSPMLIASLSAVGAGVAPGRRDHPARVSTLSASSAPMLEGTW